MTDLTFGEWLKRQRMGRGLTRDQLADQIGCATVTLRKIEAEERRPSEQIVTRIADIFNIQKNERASFLKFARGDWTKAPAERPIEIPHPSVAETRHNLRASLSSFIGRAHEIAAVRDYLNTPEMRLVTLLGPPGIGKTRLSLAIAREALADFRDGVFFVELAPLEDSQLVAFTTAQTLGFQEAPDKAPAQRISESIGDKKMLIVLDNIEHMLDATAALASDLLSACPRLKILTTSREPLRTPGEWLYPVPVLTSPTEAETSTLRPRDYFNFTALKLFHERARAVNPEFTLTSDNIQTVTSICTHLDGLPLAIELLAARVHTLSVDDLLAQMSYAFILSADGMRAVPARQKTLQNAIGWSYHLLSEAEKILFRRLSIFTGGWTLEAMTSACADENLPAEKISGILSRLVEKSLVVEQEAGGALRYSMLVTIRQFAHDRLADANEVEVVSNRHLAYFLKLAEETESKLHGPTQAESLDLMEIEMDNFRAALRWGLKHNHESGVLLAGAMWLFWYMHSHFAEANQWYGEAMVVSKNTTRLAQMRVLIGAGSNAMGRGDNENCASYSEQSLAIARELGNTWGIAMSLHHWGQVVKQFGDLATAQTLLEEGLAVARKSNHWAVLGYLLDDIGGLAIARNDYKQAELYWIEMRELSEKHGDKWDTGHTYCSLAYLACLQQNYKRAKELARTSLSLAVETNNTRLIAVDWKLLGVIAYHHGELKKAVRLFSAADQLARSIDTTIDPSEAEMNDIRTQMDIATIESLQVEGESMSMEQAIALAMAT